jgi:predicted transcriptional regulator
VTCENVGEKFHEIAHIAEETAIEHEDYNFTISKLQNEIDQLVNDELDDNLRSLKVLLVSIVENEKLILAKSDIVIESVENLLERLEVFIDEECGGHSTTKAA